MWENATTLITGCYATGSVVGSDNVGGLVGEARGSVTSCYAIGSVKGNEQVGGLVGNARGSITSSYAIGGTEGDTNVGGLVGNLEADGTITASYYDNSSTPKGIGGLEDSDQLQVAVSKTTSELQSPTDYTGIYATWNEDGSDLWDFLDVNRYPKLKADWNGDDLATVAEFGPRALIFVDADGVETRHLPVFRIVEGTPPGTTVGTLPSVVNSVSGVAAAVSLVGTSNEFELNGLDINVKTDASFSYQTKKSYTLTLEFVEGGITERRSVVIEIISPLDEDLDGLIAVSTLTQLNAIRYDLDGDGMVDSPSNASAYEEAFGLESGEVVACVSGCLGYELMADLDFNDTNPEVPGNQLSIWAEEAASEGVSGALIEGWGPIGNSGPKYTGVFEGNGHTISNLYINRGSSDYIGLFGATNGANIRNLGLEGGSVVGGNWVGPLVGNANYGTIRSCYTMVGVRGDTNVGGLVGRMWNARAINCYATGEIRGNNNHVGGLVGVMTEGSLTDCYATGHVEGASLRTGGLVGNATDVTLTSCYATGDVDGGSYDVGGLMGEINGVTLTSCYATGAVSGDDDVDNIGGLVGHARNISSIRTSYATGTVNGNTDVGGLVGLIDVGSSVTTSYAMGAVNGNTDVGGLVGEIRGTLTSCYATGNVDGSDNVGGLVGLLNESSIRASYSLGSVRGRVGIGGLLGGIVNNGTITASYYDNSFATLGIGGIEGAGQTEQAAVSKTTSELQSPTDYTGIYVDWNIDDTDPWDFIGANRYPKLKADWDGNGTTTAAEFGPQVLIFVDAGDVEVPRLPVFRIVEGTTPGTTIGTLPAAIHAVDGSSATVTFVNISDEFELGGLDINVKTDASFNYQIEQRYELILQFEGGGITIRRSVFVEVINSNDRDGDGLIDITTLAQLNALRFDLNGDGMVDSDVDDVGVQAYEEVFGLESGEVACASGCVGYELVNSLDFNDMDPMAPDNQLSIWAEGAVAANIPNAVPEGWEPIGDNETPFGSPYTATFEGNGNTISNLFINRPLTEWVGLFGGVSVGVLRNLGLEGGRIVGRGETGALVGSTTNNTTMTSCYATSEVVGTITGGIGGLAGSAWGSITSCYATGEVIGGLLSSSVGGLVGSVTGSVTGCYATGDVEGGVVVGGLVGSATASVTRCYATGDVEGKGNDVGGLVGSVRSILDYGASVTNCYATGDVEGNGTYIGGLVGELRDANVANCYAMGYVEGNGTYVGGLIGNMRSANVANCYATGDVDGNTDVGGLVGLVDGSSSLRACYAIGGIRGIRGRKDNDQIGGLVGNLESGGGITASYYDNPSAPKGIGNLSVDHSTQSTVSKTMFELQFSTDHSGIYEDWNINREKSWDFLSSNRYPRLRVDFNDDGDTTVAEFGPQLLLFVDASDVEIRRVSFEIAGSTAGGATVGTLPAAINDENSVAATVNLVGMSDEFEVSGSDLNVKATTTFDYQMEHRYRLVFELEEGGLTTKRSVFIEITNPRAEYVDGLIDITTLAQLAAIRFDLNGDGMPDRDISMEDSVAYETAFGLMRGEVACASGCVGYELMNALDFRLGATQTADYSVWAEGSTASEAVPAGWLPIGTNSNPYTGVFEGNSHTISNLFIDRPGTDAVGFFGNVDGGVIRNLGIEEADVTGKNSVAGLVGDATRSSIKACYSVGNVSGGLIVGGLAGYAVRSNIKACYSVGNVSSVVGVTGGFVGATTDSSIEACYSIGNVDGEDIAGGLVGEVAQTSIEACYSIGNVDGLSGVGGLVGAADNLSIGIGPNNSIEACYSMGNVSGAANVGGLVGFAQTVSIAACYSVGSVDALEDVIGRLNGSGIVGGLVGDFKSDVSITDSYYDDLSALKGVGSLGGGHALQAATSRTTSALQSPTDYSDIYEDWNAEGDDLWDFLGSNRYPRLKVDFNDDGTATFAEFGPQVLVLVGEGGLEVGPVFRIADNTAGGTTIATLSGTNAVNSNAAMVSLVETSDEFELDGGSTLKVKAGVSLNYQMEHRHKLTLQLEEGGLTVGRPVAIEIINPNDEDGDGLIDIPTLDQLNMVRFDLNGDGMIDAGVSMEDSVAYETAFGLMRGEVACASGCVGYELMNALDFRLGATQTADYSVWAEGSTASEAVPAGWLPIGTNSNPYTGVFEGNSHTISNLFIDRPGTDAVGFFGNVDGGVIRNLGIEEADVTGKNSVAGLVGDATRSSIKACYSVGNVSGGLIVGGLAGYAVRSNIKACYSVGNVSSVVGVTGGFVGATTDSSIEACYSIGNVDGEDIAGGLVGEVAQTSIEACYSIGNVDGLSGVGGLVGAADNLSIGIGPNNSIEACYSMGNVSGAANVGGLVGFAQTVSIAACYSVGSVDALEDVIGRLNGSGIVGGLVGDFKSDVSITDSYYDDLSALKGVGSLGGGHALQAATSRTTSALQSPTDYSDIYEDWNAEGDDLWDFLGSNRYPRLKVDFNDDGTATFAEFGPQVLVLVGEGGLEVGPVFRIADNTAGGTTIATLSGTNAVNSNAAMVSLVETSDEFELDGGSTLKVKAGVSLNYQMEHRHKLTLQLEEGGLTVGRPVAIEIISPFDDDGDGLIDITTLEQLNMVRFDLNGDGMIDAGVSMEDTESYEMAFGLESGEVACASGCEGYELMNDLDFRLGATQTADYSVWAEGSTASEAVPAGWLPIGTNSNPYTGVFEGNGYVISNLFIDRPGTDAVGFFGNVDGGVIRNLGIERGIVKGRYNVGSLVGRIEGSGSSIVSCYSTVSVIGDQGHVGGLLGSSEGSVTSCYATGSVEGDSEVGGLLGSSEGSVTSCYAMGSVEGDSEVGGLVGSISGSIEACYSTGRVNGANNVGGLIGERVDEATLTASYYDSDVSTADRGVGNEAVDAAIQAELAKTTSELQMPMVYDDNMDDMDGSSIYEGWNIDVDDGLAVGIEDATQAGDAEADDPWDFGEVREYPALKVDFNGDGVATVPEFGVNQRARLLSFSPMSAVVGTEVKIAGLGLLSDAMSSVSFGGSAFADATFIEGSALDASVADTLSIDVPRDAQTGILSIRIEGLMALSTSERFTVIPQIAGFSPMLGPEASVVVVRGSGFSPVPSDNAVKFGGVQASVPTDVSTMSLTVEVPVGAQTGFITVEVNGQTATSSDEFTVDNSVVAIPMIDGFSPSSGPVSTTVVIMGGNFSDMPEDNVVKFGGVQASVPTDVSTMSLTVEVPVGAQTGTITVEVNGQTATSSDEFTVDNSVVAIPMIDGFSPSSGPVSTTVVIMGGNFSDMPEDNVVKFGGVQASVPTDVSTMSLTVEVPVGAQTGFITVEVNGQTATSSDEFTVDNSVVAIPMIDGFSPSSGPVSTTVVIMGGNFSDMPEDNVVKFGGVQASVPTDVSTMSLTVEVPVGAQTGFITVEVNGQTATSSDEFTVDNSVVAIPQIAGFSPMLGPEASVVVVRGSGFSPVPSDNVVKFGGVQASVPTDVSTMSLTVEVPVGAQTGFITVEVNGQTATSSDEFTVDNSVVAIPMIDGFSPSSGPVSTTVVIMGGNFSDMPEDNVVKFGGVQASVPTDVSTMSLTVEVPAGAQTGFITVEVNGQTATSSDEFTVMSAPGAPMSLVASTVSATEIGLSWMMPTSEGSSPITSYELELSTDGGSMFVSLGTTDENTLSYQHTGLSATTTYHYRVAAVNSVGRGLYSSMASAMTSPSGTDEPGTGGSGNEMTFGLPQEGDTLYVYPNPSLGEVRFGGVSLGAPYVYKMYRIDGRLAHTGTFVGDSSVDIGSLSEGCYLLVLQSAGDEVLRTRLCILK